MPENSGLYEKFTVTRNDGKSEPGEKHDGCDYFVLDMTHDPAAMRAMEAYVEAIWSTRPMLAAALEQKYS